MLEVRGFTHLAGIAVRNQKVGVPHTRVYGGLIVGAAERLGVEVLVHRKFQNHSKSRHRQDQRNVVVLSNSYRSPR